MEVYSSVADEFAYVSIKNDMFVNAIAAVSARKFKADGGIERKSTWYFVIKNFFGNSVILPIFSRSKNFKDVLLDVKTYLQEHLAISSSISVFKKHYERSCLAIMKSIHMIGDVDKNENIKDKIHHGTVMAGAMLFISDDNAIVDVSRRLILTTMSFESVT